MRNYRNPIYIWILLFTVVRLYLVWLLPFDHTGDGWGYACDLLKGDLKNGHHLIFQYFQHFWYQLYILLGGKAARAIELLTSINIIFSGIILLFLVKINRLLIPQITDSAQLVLLGFISLSMSFNRYSFENETYIIPLLLIVVAFLFWLKAIQSQSKLHFLLVIFFCFLAPLFHQTAIWGCLAIFTGSIRFNEKLGFSKGSIISIGLLIVGFWWLVYYLFAAQVYHIQIFALVFQDVISGQVETSWSLKTLVFSTVNFIRTFVEFKGSTLILIKGDKIAQLLVLVVFCLLLLEVRKFFNFKKSTDNTQSNLSKTNMIIWADLNREKSHEGYFTLGIMIILHTAFAVFSQGNHEFMLPLACFIPMYLMRSNRFNFIFKRNTLMILFLWNGFFFYYVNFKNKNLIQTWDKDSLLSDLILSQYSNFPYNQGITFVSTEASRIYNYSEYNWLTKYQNELYATTKIDCKNWIYRNISIEFSLPNPTTGMKSIVISDFQQQQLNLNRANLTYRQKYTEASKQTVIATKQKLLDTYQISVIDWIKS